VRLPGTGLWSTPSASGRRSRAGSRTQANQRDYSRAREVLTDRCNGGRRMR
jgi:hypothetical protein